MPAARLEQPDASSAAYRLAPPVPLGIDVHEASCLTRVATAPFMVPAACPAIDWPEVPIHNLLAEVALASQVLHGASLATTELL